jgi:hypothetical protein
MVDPIIDDEENDEDEMVDNSIPLDEDEEEEEEDIPLEDEEDEDE